MTFSTKWDKLLIYEKLRLNFLYLPNPKYNVTEA